MSGRSLPGKAAVPGEETTHVGPETSQDSPKEAEGSPCCSLHVSTGQDTRRQQPATSPARRWPTVLLVSIPHLWVGIKPSWRRFAHPWNDEIDVAKRLALPQPAAVTAGSGRRVTPSRSRELCIPKMEVPGNHSVERDVDLYLLPYFSTVPPESLRSLISRKGSEILLMKMI